MFNKTMTLLFTALLFTVPIASEAATLSYSGEVTYSTNVLAAAIQVGAEMEGLIIAEDSALASGLIGVGDIISLDIRSGDFCITFEESGCVGIELSIFNFDSVAITGTNGSLGGGFSATAVSSVFQIPFSVSFDFDAGTFLIATRGLGTAGGVGTLQAPVPLPASIWLMSSALLGLLIRHCGKQ